MPDRPANPVTPATFATHRTPGTPMVSPEGTPFFVATGFVCLDVLYTGGQGERADWEKLHDPEDLANWISGCAVVSDGVAPSDVSVADAELDAARELREVIWRGANDLVDGRGIDGHVEQALSRFAAAPTVVPRLAGGRLVTRTPVGAAEVLSALARDAIALFAGPQAARLRRCDAHDCNLLFVDTSRPGRRRWCAMARCGNRAKVRAHRTPEPEETPR